MHSLERVAVALPRRSGGHCVTVLAFALSVAHWPVPESIWSATKSRAGWVECGLAGARRHREGRYAGGEPPCKLSPEPKKRGTRTRSGDSDRQPGVHAQVRSVSPRPPTDKGVGGPESTSY